MILGIGIEKKYKMRIISYNVNGIRAAMKKGIVDWLKSQNADVFCIQEAKANLDQVDITPFEELGYFVNWHSAKKKGYSGVVTFSKKEPDMVDFGWGIDQIDSEGRVLRTDFGDLTILNCYFPSGTSGEERQAFKMVFLDEIFDYVQDLKKTRKNIIVLGDYNIAHEEIDIHDPVRNKKNSGFLPEERAWMTKWLKNGLVDSFRHLNPDQVQYSWWTYRANARANNKGWRIDYQTVSTPLVDKLIYAQQLTDVVHSDHCPVLLEISDE